MDESRVSCCFQYSAESKVVLCGGDQGVMMMGPVGPQSVRGGGGDG
jgi:hypothetical protein